MLALQQDPKPKPPRGPKQRTGDRQWSSKNFTQNNVFQKRNESAPRSSSSPQSIVVSCLTDTELQQDSVVGAFEFDSSRFTPSQRPVRELPRFLIFQPPSLTSGPIIQDEWDKNNQDKMLQAEAAAKDPSSLYEDFQKMREIERSTMEEKGLVDKQGTRKTLEDAIAFKGSCLDMCPVYERIRRSIENDVRKYEKDPSGRLSRQLAVKAFSRPAAGQPPPLPSDVRPPQVLVKTLNFLVDNIIEELPEAQSFLWDRTRSIRQDFTYQNYSGPEAVECHEKIVRIHILTLHIMAKSTVEYSQQQEIEQMNKALKTLSEMYAEYRCRGVIPPNEAEFRAYYLLSQLRDPELEREIQSLPDQILRDSNVQLALNLRNMVQTNIVERAFKNTENVLNLFTNFFHNFKSGSIPILLSYMIEIRLNDIRFYALKAIKRSMHTKAKPTYRLDYIQDLLAFENTEETITFMDYYGIDIVKMNGTQLIDLVSLTHNSHLIPDKKPLKQPYSTRHDAKVQSLKSLINVGKSNLDGITIPQDPVATLKKDVFPAMTTTSAFGSASSAPVQDASPSSGFMFSMPDPKEQEAKRQAAEAQSAREKEMKEERERLAAEQKKVEEEKERLRREQEEKLRLEQEEKMRLNEMKQRMLQKQEARRKKRLDLIDTIGESVMKQMVTSVVSNLVHDVIGPIVNDKLSRKRKKENLLKSYSEGLYEAFIGEIVYIESLDVMASSFREKKLKTMLVKKACSIARECKSKSDLKKRKREELLDASRSFGIPKMIKRKKTKHGTVLVSPSNNEVSTTALAHSTTSGPSPQYKSRRALPPSTQSNGPKPVDLSPLNFDGLLHNLDKHPFDHYEMLVYSEEWESTTSKFLQRKFSLADGMHKSLHGDKSTLEVIGTDKIDPRNFENLNLLVFNCDGIEKIRTQRLLLKELIDGISLNTNFKFDVMVIYWEFEGIIKFTINEILQELRIPHHDAIGKVEILKLDPSLNCEGVQSALNKMCDRVELSARGEYNHRYERPTKPLLSLGGGVEAKKKKPKGFLIAADSPDFARGSSMESPLSPPARLPQKNKRVLKNLERHIVGSPRAKPMPKLLSNGDAFAIPSMKSTTITGNNQKKSIKPAVFNDSPMGFGDMFKPKKNKLKVDVYSTPRPKSSELAQTPSFSDHTSSTISNLSNITFANHSVSTPIIQKPQTYADVVHESIKTDDKDDEGQGVPKSILELRKLAASVKERHGRKKE